MMSAQDRTQSLIDEFELLDDWEERYRYVIELGRELEPLTDSEHDESHRVHGCASQVWLVAEPSGAAPGALKFRGDSDAHIVRGLVAILLDLYSDRPPADILAFDARAAFEQMGLGEHLTPQRSNGFYAMVQRIRNDATASLDV